MRMYTEAEFYREPDDVVLQRAPPRCYIEKNRPACDPGDDERMRWDFYAVALILMSSLLAASIWVVHG
jgi:hypothetical protein